jgi:Helix-turn-helix domain
MRPDARIVLACVRHCSVPTETELLQLGDLLKQWRERLGLRRVDVARRVGISPSYVAVVEDAIVRPGGKPSRPKQPLLRAWCRALGMTRQDLALALDYAGYAIREAPKGVRAGRAVQTMTQDSDRYAALDEDLLLAELRDVLELAALDGRRAEVEKALRPIFRLLRSWLESR